MKTSLILLLQVKALYSPIHNDQSTMARSLARVYMALIRHYSGHLDASIKIKDDPLVLDLSPVDSSLIKLYKIILFKLGISQNLVLQMYIYIQQTILNTDWVQNMSNLWFGTPKRSSTDRLDYCRKDWAQPGRTKMEKRKYDFCPAVSHYKAPVHNNSTSKSFISNKQFTGSLHF